MRVPDHIAEILRSVGVDDNWGADQIEKFIEALPEAGGVSNVGANQGDRTTAPSESLARIADVLEAWAGGHFNYYPKRERHKPPITEEILAREQVLEMGLDDLGAIERQWPGNPATIDPKDATIVPTDLLKRMISCIRDCAMEAEIGHELSGFRVTLLQRYGLTDGTDPAFGPVKYETPPTEPEPF